MQETMKEVAPVIMSEGKEVPFSDYLEMIGGEIFDDESHLILKAASDPQTEWLEVVEYVAPLTREILSIAVEDDREVYLKLVSTIKEAYETLRSGRHADKEYSINEDTPDLAHVVEELVHDLRSGMVIKDATFHEAGVMDLVVGLK